MDNQIIEILKKEKYINANRLAKLLGTQRDIAKTLLNDLKSRKIVTKIGNVYYYIMTGTIQVKDRGYGFIKCDGEDEDFYVGQGLTKGAASGDTVAFYLTNSKRGRLFDAVVTEVVDRKTKVITGELTKKTNKNGSLYFLKAKTGDFDTTCYINDEDLNGAVSGNVVCVKIIDYLGLDKTRGVVVQILGYIDDPGIDIASVAGRYEFFTEFPQPVLDEIIKIPNSIDPTCYPNRKDFRNKKIITIDGDDSKDFDDAINVEILENGNYYLGVYIADVAEYVKDGSALNDEALYRATSVYLADRVIPMLPHKLSNGVCSLNENEDRLVLACEMEFSPTGSLVNYSISEGIIRSCHRMTYNNVNKILNNDEKLIQQYSDIYDMLLNAHKLSKILRAVRVKKGSIDFDVPEYKAILDKKGNPIDFELRTRDVAELLIEDFMLAANETVAYHMSISNLPCVYRVHENPDQESVENVYRLINTLGYKVILPKNKIQPKDIQKTMNLVKNSESYQVVNQLMLRSMAKAKYSEANLGHYGLAMRYYCHFTSPIRRYPDLMVHRIIKSLIIHPDKFDDDLIYYASIIHNISTHSSVKEREAIECEREVMDMLMAQYMESHIGEQMVGTIDSVTKFGLFVLLPNGVEGLVHISTLNGYYIFNEAKMELYSSHKVYTIGQKVDIIVTGASKASRKVDFIIKDDNIVVGGEENV